MNRIYNTVISHRSQYDDNGDVCLSEPSRSGCFYLPLYVKEVNNQNAQPGTGQVSYNSQFCFKWFENKQIVMAWPKVVTYNHMSMSRSLLKAQ